MPVRYLRLADVANGSAGVGTRPGRPVVVAGRSEGGPDRLTGPVADALIACERGGMPTVLLAGDLVDLDTPLAAVCRYVACARTDVLEEAERRFGADRVRAVGSIQSSEIAGWIDEVSAAARPSRLQLRVGDIADRITSLRVAYGRIRRRGE